MAATVTIFQHVEVSLDGQPHTIGSRVTPQTLTLTSDEVFDVRTPVIAAAPAQTDDFIQQILWTSGNGGVSTFSVLVFVADAACVIELRTDASGDDAVGFAAFEVTADIPLILTKDDASAAAATVLNGGDLVVDLNLIDRIEVKNNAGTTSTINVHLMLLG